HFRLLILAGVTLAGCTGQPPAEQPAAPKTDPEVASKQETAKTPENKDRIILTARAAGQVRTLMQQRQAKYLRVSVSTRQEYKLDLDQQMDPLNDLLGESRGIPIVVDRKSASLLPMGIRVDFVNEAGRAGF